MNRAERQMRALRAERARHDVPNLVRAQPALASAVVKLQQALDDLLTTSKPSPWHVAGRLLAVLDSEPEDFDGWGELLEEANTAHNDGVIDDIEYAMNELMAELIVLDSGCRSVWS